MNRKVEAKDLYDYLDEEEDINDVDKLQIRDVMDYLLERKRYCHRPITRTELVKYFDGILSKRAVLKQLERLLKWELVIEKEAKYTEGRAKKVVLLYGAK